MPDTAVKAVPQRLQIPSIVWPLALLVGALLAAASLSYTPGGRINVLWLWLLWAGLPGIGALVSLIYLIFGRARPWLFRWGRGRLHWYPNRSQRWHMLWLLQLFWLWLGLGMLLGFWLLLLFTDLAFGWSSTLLSNDQTPGGLLRTLALPWLYLWPSAVPDLELLEATRYWRIESAGASGDRAGDWWPFLMASLLVYNLLPRTLLAGYSYWRWQRLSRPERGPDITPTEAGRGSGFVDRPIREQTLALWSDVAVLDWEIDTGSGVHLGSACWQDDERALERLLSNQPRRLLWRVEANRSPVGELGDLIERARRSGVREQGLLAVADRQTRTERHLTSWRRFCQQQQLTWVTP